MTDEEHEVLIRQRSDQLNKAIQAAHEAGLRVNFITSVHIGKFSYTQVGSVFVDRPPTD